MVGLCLTLSKANDEKNSTFTLLFSKVSINVQQIVPGYYYVYSDGGNQKWYDIVKIFCYVCYSIIFFSHCFFFW